tara:strand:+ start:14146 stop:14508 length:363 start_codon:yes stop_codon:yes gene_type:complete
MTVRGVRGATTADDNSRSAILKATSELLNEIVDKNDISVNDIASVFFTTTADLNAEFPAAAARNIGWENVALMCGHEMSVPDAQNRCIRVMLLINTEKSAKDIKNVYLKDAIGLRDRPTN